MNAHLEVSAEIREAVSAGRPVVALESTIISHGFPYPANVESALECERICRTEGATPATVAILDGRLRVGLSAEEIERLGSPNSGPVVKVSRRDLAAIVATGGTGATTVASTMVIAAMAGVRVFATGGIGGVHRGAQQTFDISADLLELARTPVAVVSAGAKSILDLPLTLEVLETHGVPVIGYRTDEFPAFYTRTSGLAVDARCDSALAVATMLRTRDELALGGGTLVVNPIEQDHEIASAELDAWIESALDAAARDGVRGKDTTPYLLAYLHKVSGGRTEAANKQLVWSNVRLAAQIAGALGEL